MVPDVAAPAGAAVVLTAAAGAEVAAAPVAAGFGGLVGVGAPVVAAGGDGAGALHADSSSAIPAKPPRRSSARRLSPRVGPAGAPSCPAAGNSAGCVIVCAPLSVPARWRLPARVRLGASPRQSATCLSHRSPGLIIHGPLAGID